MAQLVERALFEFGETDPVFESEIEFQLEFAIWLRLHYPDLGVKLEQRVYPDPKNRLDMALEEVWTAIELKIVVTPTSPADAVRYGFMNDVGHLEQLCEEPCVFQAKVATCSNRK